jgi:hypothetical protein
VQNAGNPNSAVNVTIEHDVLTLFYSSQAWPDLSALPTQHGVLQQPGDTHLQLTEIALSLVSPHVSDE